MSEAHNKLARILRTQPEVLLSLEMTLNRLTGKSGIIDKIWEENNLLVNRTLEELGLNSQECDAGAVYDILVKRLTRMDEHLFNFLDRPDLSKMSAVCGKLCDVALGLSKGTAGNSPSVGLGRLSTTGFFIKKEKAIEMLEAFPPHNLLEHFGYKGAVELVEKQGLESVFSALRFSQDQQWMHDFFDKAYGELKAEDFEEREVVLKILEPQWLDVAEKFLEKKYHNVSHLKELGIIFIVPLKIDTPGETLRLFTLLLHYLNEVPFYSGLFRKFSTKPDFAVNLKSLLRGDVPDGLVPGAGDADSGLSVRIVQRYLAKDDQNDFRLIEPHINPEAEHWYKAEGDLGKLTPLVEGGGNAFGYWQGLDFVGDFFPSFAKASTFAEDSADKSAGEHDGASGQATETLVSFDLIDLVMSLVKKGEIKYLYHQQEALWNKIFIEYFGRDKINELVEENIIDGFIKL